VRSVAAIATIALLLSGCGHEPVRDYSGAVRELPVMVKPAASGNAKLTPSAIAEMMEADRRLCNEKANRYALQMTDPLARKSVLSDSAPDANAATAAPAKPVPKSICMAATQVAFSCWAEARDRRLAEYGTPVYELKPIESGRLCHSDTSIDKQYRPSCNGRQYWRCMQERRYAAK
jgi:hypothetical protein